MGFTTVGAEPIAVLCGADVVRVSWSIADVASEKMFHCLLLKINEQDSRHAIGAQYDVTTIVFPSARYASQS